MSEQINPIVSEKDMGADGKLRKWSTGRKAKWIIWIVVILAVDRSSAASDVYKRQSGISTICAPTAR